MGTVFLSTLNQMEYHLVQNRKENCPHDHIPFNVKGNGILVFSVYSQINTFIWEYWKARGLSPVGVPARGDQNPLINFWELQVAPPGACLLCWDSALHNTAFRKLAFAPLVLIGNFRKKSNRRYSELIYIIIHLLSL